MAQSAISQHVAALAGIPSQPTAKTVPGALKPGYRLVPARIGRSTDEGIIVHLPCPTWCVVDHVAEKSVFLEDVNHEGERRAMSFTPSSGPRVPVEVYLSQWPGSHEPQTQLAVDLDYEVETYDRTAALALADQMAAFAEDVRRLAETLPDDSRVRGEAV
ncbi:DUF6907 domain-containing protein [Streptomyces sp. NPDC101110]|uniref:DUF6907 domain-containing protein n=1 Tax=Streptomyces sp. NPDC101110 TaxID=3366104 RepID=UPI00382C5FEC